MREIVPSMIMINPNIKFGVFTVCLPRIWRYGVGRNIAGFVGVL